MSLKAKVFKCSLGIWSLKRGNFKQSDALSRFSGSSVNSPQIKYFKSAEYLYSSQVVYV